MRGASKNMLASINELAAKAAQAEASIDGSGSSAVNNGTLIVGLQPVLTALWVSVKATRAGRAGGARQRRGEGGTTSSPSSPTSGVISAVSWSLGGPSRTCVRGRSGVAAPGASVGAPEVRSSGPASESAPG